MKTHNSYDRIAKFYDDVIGRSFEPAFFLKDLINKYSSNVTSVLELGCGTGGILEVLSRDYDVSGVDLSEEMLKIARRKNPNVSFSKQSIVDFKLDKKFDAVICVYDTINHLTKFSEWKKLFRNVYKHLNQSGIFLFDINTISKLDNLAYLSSFVEKFSENYLVIDVKKLGKNLYDWELKVFENIRNDEYRLHVENIKEVSFLIKRIKDELRKNFIIKKALTEESKRVSGNSDRVYFVCKKKI